MRFIDDNRSEREVPYGSMNEFAEGTLADRQFYRQVSDDNEVALNEAIRSIVAQVRDAVVGCGPTTTGVKIRPDRKYTELFLRRVVQRRPPRQLAIEFACSARYVRFAVAQGRKISETMGVEGCRKALADAPTQCRIDAAIPSD